MKTLKVLIIEDQRGIALAITRLIKELLSFLGTEINFIYAEEYEEARLKIMSDNYDIISLDGILANCVPSLNLIGTILGLHPKAVVFFLSSSGNFVRTAKDCGIKLSFTKGEEQIIKYDDLLKIKTALTEKGIIGNEALYQELSNPLLIFSETKVAPELFQEAKEPEYVLVARALNISGVNFAIVDRGASAKIFVNADDSQTVKKLAEISELEFWINWSHQKIK